MLLLIILVMKSSVSDSIESETKYFCLINEEK